jgi:hypothetical protein
VSVGRSSPSSYCAGILRTGMLKPATFGCHFVHAARDDTNPSEGSCCPRLRFGLVLRGSYRELNPDCAEAFPRHQPDAFRISPPRSIFGRKSVSCVSFDSAGICPTPVAMPGLDSGRLRQDIGDYEKKMGR